MIGEAADRHSPKTTNHQAQTAEDSVTQGADVEPRHGGLVRATFSRTATGECATCAATFVSTGAAASHARSSRHTVHCAYSTRFSFIAVESLDGTR